MEGAVSAPISPLPYRAPFDNSAQEINQTTHKILVRRSWATSWHHGRRLASLDGLAPPATGAAKEVAAAS